MSKARNFNDYRLQNNFFLRKPKVVLRKIKGLYSNPKLSHEMNRLWIIYLSWSFSEKFSLRSIPRSASGARSGPTALSTRFRARSAQFRRPAGSGGKPSPGRASASCRGLAPWRPETLAAAFASRSAGQGRTVAASAARTCSGWGWPAGERKWHSAQRNLRSNLRANILTLRQARFKFKGWVDYLK